MKTSEFAKPYIDVIKEVNLMYKDEWTIKNFVGVIYSFLYVKSDISFPDLRDILKDKSIAIGIITIPIPELFTLIGINHPPLSDESTIWIKKGKDYTIRLTKDSFSRYKSSDSVKVDREGIYSFLGEIAEIIEKDLEGGEQ